MKGLLLTVLAAGFAGCGSYYCVGVSDLTEAGVGFLGEGAIRVKIEAEGRFFSDGPGNDCGLTGPVPDEVTVTWKTKSGEQHSKLVSLRPLVPRRFSGELDFRILDGGEVELEAETWKEIKAREKRERLENPPAFGPGELAIGLDATGKEYRTEGLSKWSHSELVALSGQPDPDDLLILLAKSIKFEGARYEAGQRMEILGFEMCFREYEPGVLLVEVCDPEPSTEE